MIRKLKFVALSGLFLGGFPIQATTLPPLPRNQQELDEIFAKTENLDREEKLEVLTTYLYRIHGWVNHPNHEGADELYEGIQERVLRIPGHAEYVARQLREPWEASIENNLKGYGTYMSIREARFKLLSFMPSPETVKLMADFIDYSNHPHPRVEHGFPAYDAVKVLLQLLEDPPVERVAPFKPWIQWREDVEAGKITYRLKGVGGEYNFKGPVASGSSSDRHGSRPSPGRKKVTEGESADAGASEDRSPVTMIVIAAVILVGAVAWFMVSRRTVSG